MEKGKFLYEGKAKQIYETNDLDKIIIYYKDDATAFNGVKKDVIKDKGVLNNKITELLFQSLEKEGVPTHFIERLSDREQLCHKVEIFPLEVIIRNRIAGSMAKRLNIKEGTKPSNVIFELSYKNDELGDPLINDDHAVAIGACTYDELNTIKDITYKINNHLKKLFGKEGILLIDFKIEFGKKSDGTICLADEISPDTCRLWDELTMEKLDKDRFRRDLGSVEEAYIEILERLNK